MEQAELEEAELTGTGMTPRGPDPAELLPEARHLLRVTRSGALATLTAAGAPFVSLVNAATDCDGAPILLMSRLAAHTLHLEADPRASLLLAATGKGDPLAHPRLTLSGRVSRDGEPRLRARFLARHPKSALYADFPDFSFWRMEVEAVHLNGGFARAAAIAPAELLLPGPQALALAQGEAGALAHMNADHADAIGLYATRLAGQAPGPWRMSGLDCEGLDLICGERSARLLFSRPAEKPGDLRILLKDMAEAARQGEGASSPLDAENS